MVMFLFALVVLAVGVAAFGYYNPGTEDVVLYHYKFGGLPRWWIPGAAGGVILFLLLLHSLFTRFRIGRVRAANARLAAMDRRSAEYERSRPRAGEPAPAPAAREEVPAEEANRRHDPAPGAGGDGVPESRGDSARPVAPEDHTS